MVTVGSTSAWWGHWPRPERYGILAWYTAVPMVGRALPTFPAHLAGMGPNIASSLVRDWARWGRHPDYLWGPFGLHPRHHEYRGKVLAYSFADDRLGCKRAVDALHHRFSRAQMSRRHVQRGGHFGYFRAGVGEELWQETVGWMARE